MPTSDADAVLRFGERMGAALPRAITDTFGGDTTLAALTPGVLPLLVLELGDGHHLHLEIEVSTGRGPSQNLVLLMRPTDATTLFDLDPVDPDTLGQADVQLRVLGEYTEGAEALAGALAGALAAEGAIVSLRVSGASLEEADASPVAATMPLGGGDAAAFTLMLQRPNGASLPVIVAASEDLAAAVGNIDTGETPPVTAARPAAFSEPAAAIPQQPEAASIPMPPLAAQAPPVAPSPPPAAPSTGTPVAHPFMFGQLSQPVPTSNKGELGIDPILDVALHLRVELGSTQMTVEQVLALTIGSVVELDRTAGEAVDIVINDRLIARGEVVVVEENFGVRITEIVTQRPRVAAGV